MKDATDILQDAIDVQSQRGQEYDGANRERSMYYIVEAFNAITGLDLQEAHGWEFMNVLKQVRFFSALNNGKVHNDSLLDMTSYASLLAECAWDNSTPDPVPSTSEGFKSAMEEYVHRVEAMVSVKAAAYAELDTLDPETDTETIDSFLKTLRNLAGQSKESPSVSTES